MAKSSGRGQRSGTPSDKVQVTGNAALWTKRSSPSGVFKDPAAGRHCPHSLLRRWFCRCRRARNPFHGVVREN